jgi:uncharacterized membrane protein YdjX (TVP38/TMEM64 family)
MSLARHHRWLKVAAPLTASLLGLLMLKALDPHFINQKTVSEWLMRFGPYAPLAFILVLGVRPLTLLPGQVFTALAGLAFGTLRGAAYSMAGSFLACALVFVLSKYLGQRLMKRLAGGKFPALQRVAKRHDFSFAAITCINPLLPTDVMIAAAAASGARFWPTALGVLLGTLPGTYLTAQFGSAVGQGKTIMTIISAVGLVASLGIGVLLGRKVVHELKEAEPEPEPAPRRPLIGSRPLPEL